jgi:hypothetical protein
MAVVWRSGELDQPRVTAAVAPTAAVVPPAPVMDRRELLRLVNAG